MHAFYKINQKYNTKVAYFCMEYAIHQPLKTYSGGLGFLAGSHMRSAHDLGQNLVGIGILWKYGYYDQEREENQTMRVNYTAKHYTFLEDTGIRVGVRIFGKEVMVGAKLLRPETFGTAPVYFLTTDLPENDAMSQTITHHLYDPNELTRIAQSIVLGIGGGKILDALNYEPQVYHINEGHALPIAFHLYDKFRSWDEVRKHFVFTTHTPEKAGNEERPFDLLQQASFFGQAPVEEIRGFAGVENNTFNYSLAALRMARKANAVSKLHGDVSRKMWQEYDRICQIDHVTNSQHVGYWTDPILRRAFESNDNVLLTSRKKELKMALFEVIADQTGDLFDPDVLTIVWARRFAGYKRPNLILRQRERLLKLLDNTDRPIQIIWAGKPYPKDEEAIHIFNDILFTTQQHKRAAILTGYELGLSALLKHGADIWLNNPRFTREASGTSGMTAAMNGAINFSNLDGWMYEYGVHKENSFIMSHADPCTPVNELDNQDAESLYEKLENDLIPTYYDHPDLWIKILRKSMEDVFPFFNSDRMAEEYYTKLYNA